MTIDLTEFKPKIYFENIEGERIECSRPVDCELQDFKLHYFSYPEFPEIKAVSVYFEKKKRYEVGNPGTLLGYLFSLSGVQNDASELQSDNPEEHQPTVQDTKIMKQYMCAVIDKFFDENQELIDEYINKTGCDVPIQLDTILAFKALKDEGGDFEFSEEIVEEIRKRRNLLVFIEDLKDSARLGYNNKYLNLFMLYNHQLIWLESSDFFRNPMAEVLLSPSWNENSIILKNLSNDIKRNDDNVKYVVDVLPALYKAAENEYLKFSILYQHIEILIGDIFKDLLLDLINNHNDKEIFNLKKKISKAMSESERIRRILQIGLNSALETEFVDKIKLLLEKTKNSTSTEEDVGDESQEESKDDHSLAKNLYMLRNTLFHNLRVFEQGENLRADLAEINNLFEKMTANLLSNFVHPSGQRRLLAGDGTEPDSGN